MELGDQNLFNGGIRPAEPKFRPLNTANKYQNPLRMLNRQLFRKDCLDRRLERHHITGCIPKIDCSS